MSSNSSFEVNVIVSGDKYFGVPSDEEEEFKHNNRSNRESDIESDIGDLDIDEWSNRANPINN